MIIRDKNDLELLKENLSPELRDNKKFQEDIEWEIYKMLQDYKYAEVYINDNGKKVVLHSGEKITNDSMPKNEVTGVEFKINENGSLEKTTSYGILYDANQYYSTRKERPSYNVSSILGVIYHHNLYDKNGIELYHSSYSKYNWPLTNVYYRDTAEFKNQLFSAGYHMPKSWSIEGPSIPLYSHGAYVSGTIRDSKYPSMATVYSYDLEGNNKFPLNRRTFLAEIHGEYPERLRVDEWGKFAIFEDGDWKVYDPYKVYEGKSVKDIILDKVSNYRNVLESSRTHEYRNPEYETLKEMIEESAKTADEERQRKM